MSFLTPLYIAGGLAIALPIIFHLIRRTPTGRQDFSSLMFLQASPPRLTKRSRLTNILLLILRAAALALLAIAFARPFFRQNADAAVTQATGRRVAILVDTSASMKRGDLWQQARNQVDRTLSELSPTDEAALYLFDRAARPAMSFAEWSSLELSQRPAVMKARLAEASPTWDATKLGESLAAVADVLAETENSEQARDHRSRQIVLVSDLQQGSRIEALQGHQWPDNVLLDVRPVAVKQTANATLQLVKEAADATDKDPSRLRVRVSNQQDSSKEQFELVWANDKGPIPGVQAHKAYVPPGKSRIVRLPWASPDSRADRLLLRGDEFDFDNTLYLVPPRKDSLRVVYVGADNPEDTKSLLFYLRSAFAETPQRLVEIVQRKPDQPLAEAELVGTRLVVVADPISDDRIRTLRRYAETAGDVLLVIRDPAAGVAVGSLLDMPGRDTQEARVRDFALIGNVDLKHPLFAPFGDARFGDFSKIRFWKHRRVTLPPDHSARVIARFDDGDPFLIEKTVGQGRVFVLTAGWHPADSQLALSTKFVPLLEGLIRRKDAALVEAHYAVHEPIALPKGEAARILTTPDNKRIDILKDVPSFGAAAIPGVYRLNIAGQETPLAVNLDPEEGRTAPAGVEELERWGAKLGAGKPSEETIERQRKLQTAELENKQKVWRWLIVLVLGLLAAETALAGRVTRRPPEQQVTS